MSFFYHYHYSHIGHFLYIYPYVLSFIYRFDIPENKDEFFTAVERALVLDHILRRTGYKSEDLVNTEDLYEPSISKISEYIYVYVHARERESIFCYRLKFISFINIHLY